MVILSRESNCDEMVEELVAALNKSENLQKEILIDEDYMSWLENFTETQLQFDDQDFVSHDNNILEVDKRHIEKLHLLYKMIEDYAKENFFFPKKDAQGIIYTIIHNDIVYEIGKNDYYRLFYFCNRIKLEGNSAAIPFSNIKNGKKLMRATLISISFQKIFDLIEELETEKIPLDTIFEIIKNMHDQNSK